MSEKAEKLALKVTGQSVISSWVKNKKEVTLYAVEAEKPDGQAWDGLPLRTFQQLPTGTVEEYEAKLYSHAEFGDSLTLKRPSEGLGKTVAQLQTVVEDLVHRVEQLEARLGEPQPEVHPSQTDPDKPRGPSLLPDVVERSGEGDPF